ncbi:reverse transcriptase domain-containing protein [Tanacetum coccineum]
MNDIIALLNDLSYIHPNNEQNEPTQGDIGKTGNEPTQAKRNEFEELYASANEELYPGCDYSFSNMYFPPRKDTSSHHHTMQSFKMIGLCRWKDSNTPGKKVPKKVLHYFPIIPRLQRLYKSSHTAKEVTWHATGKCTEPGKMQHPVDGRAWKNFDTKYSNFAKEPRNVRLGLADDDFNPFSNLSQAYSMLPVILTTYNLPPWLCMKESFFMLTLLISGLKSPSKDIDVYLRPLIDDLKVLWALKGVKSIDVATGHKFNMRAMQYLPDEVAKPIIELCSFFKQICSATLMEDDMLKAQSKVVDILCNLELIYPLAFYDIMIHLVIHLPLEALEGRPIRPR